MNLYFTFEFRNCLDLFSASKLLSELAQAKYVSQRSRYPLDSDLSGAVDSVIRLSNNLGLISHG